MSRSCEESLAIRCEKQARVSPTPNGGARGHSGENTPNKLNIGVADSRRSLSALRPQQKQKRDKPRYGILPVKPKFASAYPGGADSVKHLGTDWRWNAFCYAENACLNGRTHPGIGSCPSAIGRPGPVVLIVMSIIISDNSHLCCVGPPSLFS